MAKHDFRHFSNCSSRNGRIRVPKIAATQGKQMEQENETAEKTGPSFLEIINKIQNHLESSGDSIFFPDPGKVRPALLRSFRLLEGEAQRRKSINALSATEMEQLTTLYTLMLKLDTKAQQYLQAIRKFNKFPETPMVIQLA